MKNCISSLSWNIRWSHKIEHIPLWKQVGFENNNCQHLYSAYYVPETFPSDLPILTYLVLTTIQQSRHWWYAHFTDRILRLREAGYLGCDRRGKKWRNQDLNSGCWVPESVSLTTTPASKGSYMFTRVFPTLSTVWNPVLFSFMSTCQASIDIWICNLSITYFVRERKPSL